MSEFYSKGFTLGIFVDILEREKFKEFCVPGITSDAEVGTFPEKTSSVSKAAIHET